MLGSPVNRLRECRIRRIYTGEFMDTCAVRQSVFLPDFPLGSLVPRLAVEQFQLITPCFCGACCKFLVSSPIFLYRSFCVIFSN